MTSAASRPELELFTTACEDCRAAAGEACRWDCSSNWTEKGNNTMTTLDQVAQSPTEKTCASARRTLAAAYPHVGVVDEAAIGELICELMHLADAIQDPDERAREVEEERPFQDDYELTFRAGYAAAGAGANLYEAQVWRRAGRSL